MRGQAGRAGSSEGRTDDVNLIADVKGETCRRYAKNRLKRFKDGRVEPIADGTIRGELNVLQAAINYCHKEGHLLDPATVTLPQKPQSRDR
jgi:hypothetical protein